MEISIEEFTESLKLIQDHTYDTKDGQETARVIVGFQFELFRDTCRRSSYTFSKHLSDFEKLVNTYLFPENFG